jgi:VWFA-related protein
LHDLRQLINSVERDTQIMVVSHGQGLKVNQPFTTDVERVVEALIALERVPVAGNDSQNRFLDLLSEIESRYTQKHIVEAHVASYAQQLKQTVERGLEDLRELVDTFAGMPGRKALVYVSDSLPLTPAEELFQALQIRYRDLSSLNGIMEFHANRDFEILTQAANTAGVTFYTLHAAGLEAPLGASAEISGSGIDELRPTVDSVRTANFQGSGRVMAAETGGLALLNTNDFTKGLGQMVQDFEHYYSIGYRPRHGHDDRYHDIEVKLKRKGLTVRHRRGYRDRSFTYRMQDGVVTALQHGAEHNPFGIEVYADPILEASDDDMVVVPFAVSIPLDKLVLVPRQGFHQGRVKLFLSVRDEKGSNSPVQTVEVPIEIDNGSMEAALTSHWTQRVQLRVRPGRGMIGVGVWDEFGRTASVLRRRFDTASP